VGKPDNKKPYNTQNKTAKNVVNNSANYMTRLYSQAGQGKKYLAEMLYNKNISQK
jgi:hypothetical protein